MLATDTCQQVVVGGIVPNRTVTWYYVRCSSVTFAINSHDAALAATSQTFRPSWHISLHKDSVKVVAFCHSVTPDAGETVYSQY